MIIDWSSMTPARVLITLLDIAIVAFLAYRVLVLIRQTKAIQLIKGLVILLVATVISQRLNLVTVGWLMDKALVMLMVALPVVFQPELRRALEQLGRGRFLNRPVPVEQDDERLAHIIVTAAKVLAEQKRGALIVVERRTGLEDVVETGVLLDAKASIELLVNVFMADGPLHDGATIIRGDRLVAAGCFLPLSESVEPGSSLGGRHRAALGISEQTDAVVVVVSEETGRVSAVVGGTLRPDLTAPDLAKLLASSRARTAVLRWEGRR